VAGKAVVILGASVFLLGPHTELLLAAYWLWRRPRRWPAALPLLADVRRMAHVIALAT
jgi:hypothetical protein